MKRLLFLRLPDPDPSNQLKGEALHKAETKALNAAIKSLQEAIKIIPEIKILQDLSPLAQMVIDFPDQQKEAVYELLLTTECIEIIDSILPLSEKELKIKLKNDLKAEEIAAKRAKPIPKSKKKKKGKKSSEDEE